MHCVGNTTCSAVPLLCAIRFLGQTKKFWGFVATNADSLKNINRDSCFLLLM